MVSCWSPESTAAHLDLAVIIPARNEARYIQAALASVAGQRWPLARIETVVVDNGSTDATPEAVRAYMAQQPHLAVRLVQEPVPGQARAKNRGAGIAQADYLLFLDADSRMAPDLAGAVMGRVRAGFPAGSIAVVADGGDRIDRLFFALMELGKRLFGIRAQMFYCSRELFERFGGFDEALQLAEDREFLGRLQRAGVPVCHLDESWIATSPRRLHRLPCHLAMVGMFVRWALAHAGIGRRWRY